MQQVEVRLPSSANSVWVHEVHGSPGVDASREFLLLQGLVGVGWHPVVGVDAVVELLDGDSLMRGVVQVTGVEHMVAIEVLAELET